MHKDAYRVLQHVADAWRDVVYGVQQMSQASLIEPSDSYQIFRLDSQAPDDLVKLDFGPIVFNVPERPNHRSPDLFIVACGWLTFESPNFKELPLLTRNFGTAVGYFRHKPEFLEHVYGAHFDMDERQCGHPVFHAQFGPRPNCGTAVRDLFKRDETVIDRMGTILGTVRLPCAQMDLFSLVAQISGDHLMWRDSGPEVRSAFKRLRENCDFLVGAAHRLGFLSDPHAATCYRAAHWYDAPAANA